MGIGVHGNKKLAKDIVRLHKSVIVAGEINRDNVLDVERKLHPYAVDVCEGIEACNGQKSTRKIRGLFRRMGRHFYNRTIKVL